MKGGAPPRSRPSLDCVRSRSRFPCFPLASAACAAALCSAPAHVDAQTNGTDRHRIDFRAPDVCATSAVFLDEIRSRTPRLHVTADDAWTSRFEIEVREDGDNFRGALTVHAGRTTSERREVTAKSCEEVLETLALIVAVAIDPNASLRRLPKRAEEPQASPPPPPAAVRPVVVAPEPPKPPAPDAWQERLVLGAEARGAFADSASFAGSVGFEVERWGWAARLTALRSLESRVTDPFGREARFEWTAVRLDAGPSLRFRSLRLHGALGLDVGRVEAASELSQERWWLSALALARARWEPRAPVGAELVAGAFVPLARDRFALFDPDTVLYRERALSGLLGVGLFFRLQ